MNNQNLNGAVRPWTSDEEARLRQLWHAGYSTREIAAQLFRTPKSVKLKRFKAGLTPRSPQGHRTSVADREANPVFDSPVEEDFLAEARQHLCRRDQQILYREKIQEARRFAFEERFLELLESRLPRWQPEKASLRPPSALSNRSQPCAVLLLSDTHCGQAFSAPETDGYSSYNPRVFLSRLGYLADQILDFAEMVSSRDLHILCLGDLLHGNLNHSAEREETLLLVDQFSLCVHAFYGFFLRLLEGFPAITIRSVAGNHGRWPGQRRMPSVGRESNLDSLVIRSVELACRAAGIERIQFVPSSASRQIADIAGIRVHLLHGDQIRGGEIPHRGMMREATTATFRAAAFGQKHPDIYVMGDKHRSMSLPVGVGEFLVNGSFVSGDQFGQNFAPNRPAQTIFWLAEKRGRILQSDISLDSAPLLSIADCHIPTFLHRLL